MFTCTCFIKNYHFLKITYSLTPCLHWHPVLGQPGLARNGTIKKCSLNRTEPCRTVLARFGPGCPASVNETALEPCTREECACVRTSAVFARIQSYMATWTDDETTKLLEVWGDDDIQRQLQGCKRNLGIYMRSFPAKWQQQGTRERQYRVGRR